MVLDAQEQEQLDAFKAWWKDNRAFVILSAVILFGGIGGVQAWKSYHLQQSTKASALFAEVGAQIDSKDPLRINDAAQAVIDSFGSSAYAPRAALIAARADIQNRNNAQAKVRLQWVIDNAKEDGLKDLARLQMASLLLDEKNTDQAMHLLGAEHPATFDALYADLKGDVLVAQGKTEEARTAYQLAYGKIDDKSPYRNLVQMKLDSVGGAKK